ncbi:MAG TPA: lipoyl synthase [Candidatus Eisenbacteria bacterium]|nr:lipoyl synthase [Candidatus Eisenbacteria bacterium]
MPDWLRKSLSPGKQAASTGALLSELGLNTICDSGRCPNRDECYSQRAATFMVMGDVCTRSCGFCSVSTGRPGALDADEPRRVAEAARTLGLAHVVVTSVNRDDLPDEGAAHFVAVIRALRRALPAATVEILTPDFKRTQAAAVEVILAEEPEVFNHNVETVPRLYRTIRPQAHYETSLSIFREIRARSERAITKSGLMLGLGEEREEVLGVMRDLRAAGCDMLTLGQYLQSAGTGAPVKEFVTPATFAEYREAGRRMGYTWVESGPFVRSSFHAKESFEALRSALAERRGISVN